MGMTRLYTGPDGQTHIEHIDPASRPDLTALHATKGVVKSIDATTLVITRSTRRTKEQTFAMDGSTRQVGQVTVGATVEIRYRTEDGHRLAIVVSVQEPKSQR